MAESQTLDAPTEPLMVCEFSDGYSFRTILDYFKQTNVDGVFVFERNRITYSRSDAHNTVLNNLEIRACDLTHYRFNYDAPIAYGVNMANLKQTMAVVGKKDGVRLFSFPNQPYLFIQHLSAGNDEVSRRNASVVRIQSITPECITVTGYRRSEDDPNCTVRVQDFCKTCANIARIKCDFVTIKGSHDGVHFQGMLDGNITGSYYEFGSYTKGPFEEDSKNMKLRVLAEYLATLSLEATEESAPTSLDTGVKLVFKEPNDLNTIKVKSGHIKALSKLINSFKEGTVKMYMEPGCPFKLIFNNAYCRLEVFLQEGK